MGNVAGILTELRDIFSPASFGTGKLHTGSQEKANVHVN